MREQHPGAPSLSDSSSRVSGGKVSEHRPVERIAFVRPVQADQQDMSVPLQGYGLQGLVALL